MDLVYLVLVVTCRPGVLRTVVDGMNVETLKQLLLKKKAKLQIECSGKDSDGVDMGVKPNQSKCGQCDTKLYKSTKDRSEEEEEL